MKKTRIFDASIRAQQRETRKDRAYAGRTSDTNGVHVIKCILLFV